MNYKKLCSFLVLFMLISACEYYEKEYSAEMTEPAMVTEVIYSPPRHGSDIAPTFGMTGGGNMTVGFTSVDVKIPEVYAIVFKCQHGKFIIQTPHKKAKDLWGHLKRDQEVTVRYREVYRVLYGKDKKPIKKELLEYDFIDAK